MINEIIPVQVDVSEKRETSKKETIIKNLQLILTESDNSEQFNQLIDEDTINFILKELSAGELKNQYMELGEFLNGVQTHAPENAVELLQILHRYLCVVHSYHNWLKAEEELLDENKINEQQWPAILIGDFAIYDKINFLTKHVSFTHEARLRGVRVLLNNLQLDYNNPQIVHKQYIKNFIKQHKNAIFKAEYYREVLLGKSFEEGAVTAHNESLSSDSVPTLDFVS